LLFCPCSATPYLLNSHKNAKTPIKGQVVLFKKNKLNRSVSGEDFIYGCVDILP